MLWASKSSCGRFCLSRPKQPFPHSRSSGSSHRPDEDGGARPLPSVRAPNTRRRLRRLHLLNVQAAGQHLAGISCTHMGAHIWAMVAELVGGGPLPAHSPSLPFARLQTPKSPTTPKTLQFLRGSFHQAWPSAFAAPGLQPALCLHIPRGSFHQAPGRQRSSIAACPLPAHSPLLLGHSSLPFARLQTPKMPKTLLCLHIALSCYGIRACRLPGFKPLKPLKHSNSFAAAWFPQTVRWSILPVPTSLFTFPLQNGHL